MGAAWYPSDRYLARSRLRRFAAVHGHRDFPSLYRWSINDLDGFWRAVDRDLGLVWRTPYERVCDSSRGIAWTTWWLGGRMNYVESALRHDPSRAALVFEGEEGVTRRLTYGELAAAVRRCAAGLRALGVKPGDRVGIFLPLTPECAIATLAVAAIGAIYTPIFSGYASDAIAGRLRDCDASVLITADGFLRRGQVIQMKETADAAVDGAPGVRTVIVVPRLGRQVRLRDREVTWDFMMAQGSDESLDDTSPEDPYMLIYTSGTTGRPKGAVHVHGGFPVKAAQDLAHVFDLQSGDLLWWFTDIGWMMGPWLIAGGLINGATILLYDGAPDYPDAGRVWSIVERHRVTHLGNRHPWPDAGGRGAREATRSLAVVRARLDRGAVESGTVVVVFRRRWGEARAAHQLLRRHRMLRRHPRLHDLDAAQADGIRGSSTRNCRRRCRPAGAIGARRGGRARHPQAVARHDAGVLARSRQVRRHVLEAVSRRVGAR